LRPIIAGAGPRGVTTRRNAVVGWLLALLAIALFIRLGFWQLSRMHEKQAMVDAVQQVLDARAAKPLALAADAARARGYDWAAGDGRFADAPAVILDNQGRDERPGVRVYRAFLPDDGAPLLVELGWKPLPGDRTMPVAPRPSASHVEGLLLPPPSAGLARGTPVPQPDGSLLVIAMDLPLLRDALGLETLAPRVLKPDPARGLADAPGYARDLEILPNTLPPDRHLGYAVQWFGLAVAMLVIALVLTFRKPGRRP
jgi:cytochrome oxidase assembly protein ShyY1